MDGATSGTGLAYYVANGTFSNTHGFAYAGAGATRHNDGCNYAFLDGHAKWQKPDSIKCVAGGCNWSLY